MSKPLPGQLSLSVTGRGDTVTHGPERHETASQSAPLPVLVIGAAGRTGRCLVEFALAQGHLVTAFARNLRALPAPHARLRHVQGRLEDAEAVEQAVQRQHAVLCAVGPTGRKDAEAIAQGTRGLVEAMQRQQVRRLVYVPYHDKANGWGPSALFEKLMASFRPREANDWQRRVEVIRESSLEWVIVRPTRLTNAPATRVHQVSINQGRVPLRISRADVAEFMLEQVRSPRYVRKSPVIGG
ncbi:NAD(P)-dependent oxidoreductase [Archangium primigenium]|uniref:NAD(P)-dependent oxidoreductase n=1 Tax=[Archangium] primigenium TaxID=2792470 RepID=UPI001958FED4|nr:NAD(P)H-binding protein [Archangium primigenium]MBM7115284.1 NAD(P)H-binding protein [Archangium primigenium]